MSQKTNQIQEGLPKRTLSLSDNTKSKFMHREDGKRLIKKKKDTKWSKFIQNHKQELTKS